MASGREQETCIAPFPRILAHVVLQFSLNFQTGSHKKLPSRHAQMAALPAAIFASSRSDAALLEALRADVPAAGAGASGIAQARS